VAVAKVMSPLARQTQSKQRRWASRYLVRSLWKTGECHDHGDGADGVGRVGEMGWLLEG
jgi:hypothetical protein